MKKETVSENSECKSTWIFIFLFKLGFPPKYDLNIWSTHLNKSWETAQESFNQNIFVVQENDITLVNRIYVVTFSNFCIVRGFSSLFLQKKRKKLSVYLLTWLSIPIGMHLNRLGNTKSQIHDISSRFPINVSTFELIFQTRASS